MKFIWVVVFVCVKCSAMSRNELDEFADHLHRTSQLDLNLKSADADGVYDEDEEVSDHAWEDSGKFEGDLILNDRQRRLIVENVEGLSRNGLTDSTKRWPNNEVIYFIQKEHFNGDQVQAIQDGIEDLAQASCVKFRPYKKGDRDAVVIQGSRRGCFSQVGYQGGYQVLNLSGRHPAGRGCFRHGTVVHELLHTLGFYHMQSSPDRDDYIHVMWENIIQPARHNFRKYNTFAVSDFGVGYDYDSVLHYSRRAFSSNGKDTLVPRKNGAQIGQRVGLSDKDTQKLNKMYCDSDSNGFDADEIPTKTKTKKKKPKNQPFDGHGIGYHQGKTVIIKVPTSETYKLSVASPIQVFDFRGPAAPQAVPSPQTEDHYRFGKEITYPYKYAAETETPTLPKETVVQEEKPNAEEIDEDLAQAFDRLANIAKEKIYPKDYTFQINTDYSKFYTPKLKKNESPDDFYGNGKYKEMIIEKSPALTPNQRNTNKNPDESVENIETEDYSDSSYRTSLPVKKPYSAYTNTETPYYASREYLEGREKYSHLFSQEPDDKKEGYTIFNQKLPITESWYQKPSYQTGFGDTGNHSEEAESQEEYNQKLLKAPNKSEAYTFDAPIPLTQDWYKAHSIEPPPSYGEDSSSEINR